MFLAQSQGRTIEVLFVAASPVRILASRTTVQPFDFSGPVISILDSDTIEHALFCLHSAKSPMRIDVWGVPLGRWWFPKVKKGGKQVTTNGTTSNKKS